MSTYLLVPSSSTPTNVGTDPSTVTGSLSDGSDATYFEQGPLGPRGWPCYSYWDFTTFTLNPLETVYGGTGTVRCWTVSGSTYLKAVFMFGGVGYTIYGGGGGSVPVSPTNLTATAFAYNTDGSTYKLPITQADIDAFQAYIEYDLTYACEPRTSELTCLIGTAVTPLAPTIVPPSGIVLTTLTRPGFTVTPEDRTYAGTVTLKARTTNVCTLTCTNTWTVGQTVKVNIGDVAFDGNVVVTAASGTTFSYISPSGSGSISTVIAVANGVSTQWNTSLFSTMEWKIFTAAQYGAAGFSPDTSASFNSGTSGIYGSYYNPWTMYPTTDLVAGTYKIYSRWRTSSPGMVSPWGASAAFTMAPTQPPAPTLTASWDATNNRVTLTCQSVGNMLSPNQSSLDDNVTTGWAALLNQGAWATASVHAQYGTYSLTMVSGAAGNMALTTSIGAAGVPCVAGNRYSAIASYWGQIARTVRTDIAWYNSAGGLISTTAGSTATDTTVGWTTSSCLNALAPAGAVTMAVQTNALATAAANEVHWVDQIGVVPGATITWSPGSNLWSTLIERSLDGGTTWTTVRALSPYVASGVAGVTTAQEQAISTYDYEPARGITVGYRASSYINFSTAGSSTIASPVTSTQNVSTTNDGTWWIKCPNSPALNVGGTGSKLLRVVKGSLSFERTQDMSVHRPLGRSKAIVVTGDLEGEDGSFELVTFGDTEWAQVAAALNYQAPVVLQDPNGTQKYVRVLSPVSWKRTAGANLQRTVSVAYVEVDTP